MTKQRILSEDGLTLVELLAALTIASLIAILITSNLVGGMTSFKRVNKQISLNDEANYMMSQFVHSIYVATAVNTLDDPNYKSLIEVKHYGDDKTEKLGFRNDHKAVINGQVFHSPDVSIVPDESVMTVKDNTVSIKMVVKDNESGKQLELDNKVSFVKGNEGTGGSQ